jgi:murein endopeptidase
MQIIFWNGLLFLSLIPSGLAQSLPQPVGYYSDGSLLGAWELPLETQGLMGLFLHRDRGWGTREIIDTITLSAFNGGKITRHN